MHDGSIHSHKKRRRAVFLKQLYQWHWISSGVCLIGMILFALTGITLNHASQIEAKPRTTMRNAAVPENILLNIKSQNTGRKAALPKDLVSWLRKEIGVDTATAEAEWSAGEIYVALPRPGGDAWMSIDRRSGALSYEVTDRGWIAYFNDLHKGRNAGKSWSWFIDLFAVAALVFCLTGLLLLQLHSTRRPATWPVVGMGFVIPAVLLILFVHG